MPFVSGLAQHDDSKHVGSAKRNTANGLAGLDANGRILPSATPDYMKTNIALNAFRIAVNGSLTQFNLQDGVIDGFNDAAGLLSGIVAGGKAIFGIVPSDTVQLSNYDSTCADAIPSTATLTGVTMLYTGSVRVKFEYQASSTNNTNRRVLKNGGTVESSSRMGPYDWSAAQWDIDVVAGDVIACQIYVNAGAVCIRNLEVCYDTGDIISISTTAEEQPTNIHAVILADDTAITLNTDLIFYASVDDGVTWEQIQLEDSGDYSATERILTGSVSVVGIGTTIKYKISCIDVDYEIYAVGLLWD